MQSLIGSVSIAFKPFLSSTGRVFWVYLIGALTVALLFVVLRFKFNRRFWRRVFQSHTWFHASSLLDYQIFLMKGIARLLTASVKLTLIAGFAIFIKKQITNMVGAPELTSLSLQSIGIIYTITLFIASDLSRFLVHMAFHRVGFLWQLHQVHHSAEVLTPMTLYRTHIFEWLLAHFRSILVIGSLTGIFSYLFPFRDAYYSLMGVNAIGFVFSFLGSNLRHSHLFISYGWLEKIFISPAQHQIHHSRNEEHAHANYGVWLSIWDRLTGTLIMSEKTRRFRFGLNTEELNHNPHCLFSSQVHPLLAILNQKKMKPVLGFGLAALITLVLVSPAYAQNTVVQSKADEANKEQPKVDPKTDAKVDTKTDNNKKDNNKKDNTEVSEEDPFLENYVDLTLDTITIISNSRVAGSAHKVTEKELDQFESNDIQRVLKKVPAVYVRGEDGYGLRPNIGIRGANSDRSSKITLLEDGILLGPAPYSAPAAYYFPMMARITGVEVFKGPASVKYGPNTIGGAINLQTRGIPSAPTIFADLSGGDEETYRGHGYAGIGYNNFGVLLEGVHLQTAGFKELDLGGPTGFKKSEAQARTRFQTDPTNPYKHQVDLRLGYSVEESNETYLGLTDADFEANPYRRYVSSSLALMDWKRTQIRADYLFAARENYDIRATFYRNDLSRDWNKLNRFNNGPSLNEILANPTSGTNAVFYNILTGAEDTANDDQNLEIGNNSRSYVSQGASLKTTLNLGLGPLDNEIEVGLRYHNDYIERNHTGADYQMINSELVRNSARAVETLVLNRGETNAIAGYAHDQITFDQFLIAPGVRVEHIETKLTNKLASTSSSATNTVVLPGVGGHYQILPALAFLAGVHTGFSPVSPGQKPEVKPEKSINYEGGTRLKIDKTKFEVIGFFNDYSNLTGECTFSAGCDPDQLNEQFNAGKVHVYGFESMAEQKIQGPFKTNFTFKLMYSLTLSRFRTAFTSSNPQFGTVTVGDELPYVPKHQGSFLFGFNFDRYSLNASVAYVGEMRNTAGQGIIKGTDRIEENLVVDLAGSVRIIEGGHVYFTIKNLTQSKYMVSRRPFGARPGRPFQAQIGFKMLFQPSLKSN